MSFPSPAAGGAASFLGGFLEGYLGSKTRQAEQSYADEQRQKEYDRRVAEQEAKEERERQRRTAEIGATVQEGENLFRSLLDPSVKPEEAMLKLSSFDQARGTRFTPLYGEFAKARTTVPFIEDAEGKQVRNPYYVPKWIPRAEVVPDVKANRIWERKGQYDPLTGEWRGDKEGKPIYSDVNSLGKLFETTGRTGTGRSVSAALQENLNKMASGYIKALATKQAVDQNEAQLLEMSYGDEDKVIAAKTAALKGAETARINLDTWVNQVLPSAENAESFVSALSKASKGKTIPAGYFWKKVVENYKAGSLDDLDVQLLAYKHLTQYGAFPKGYIPAFRTSGELVPMEEEENQEEE